MPKTYGQPTTVGTLNTPNGAFSTPLEWQGKKKGSGRKKTIKGKGPISRKTASVIAATTRY